MNPLHAIAAQQVAQVLLELLRGGLARPDLLQDTLAQVPIDYRGEFLRVIQKALEQPTILRPLIL